jgi:hypothetical protein
MRKASVILAVILFAVVAPGFADIKTSPDSIDPNNVPPPSGAILDLAGTPVLTGVWTQYSVNFVATVAMTDVTFLFRNDPGYTGFDNASVTLMGGGPNLFLNPGFELGTVGAAPVDWNFENIYGAGFAGEVTSNTSPGGCSGMAPSYPFSESNGWCDGATQAYDAIDQVVPTTIGQTYTVSFWQNNIDTNGVAYAGGDYSQISVNGHNTDTDTLGNGIDTLVYVGATIPPPVGTPEPGSVVLLASAMLGLGFGLRRKFAR